MTIEWIGSVKKVENTLGQFRRFRDFPTTLKTPTRLRTPTRSTSLTSAPTCPTITINGRITVRGTRFANGCRFDFHGVVIEVLQSTGACPTVQIGAGRDTFQGQLEGSRCVYRIVGPSVSQPANAEAIAEIWVPSTVATRSARFSLNGVEWLGKSSGGLGVIPFQCWEKPGFKNCQAQQFERAKQECTAAFIPEMTVEDINDCIRSLHQRYTEEACVPQHCPPEVVTPGVSYPWLQYSASTLALQKEINRRIRERRAAQGGNGFCDISEDGKLGPITCGAAFEVYPEGVPTTCQQRRNAWKQPGLCTAASGAVSCPEGQVAVGAKCVTPVPPGAGVEPPPDVATTPVTKKSNTGVILLAVAAAGALAVAMS